MYDIASRRINRELDIVNYLKHRMIGSVQKRTIFTQMDRYLMKHQARSFVLDARQQESSSDSSDFESCKNSRGSQYERKLFDGLLNQKPDHEKAVSVVTRPTRRHPHQRIHDSSLNIDGSNQ